MHKTYVLNFDPVPWARPAGIKHRYDANKKHKDSIRLILKEQHGYNSPLFHGPLCMDVVFYLKIPVSWSSSKKMHSVGVYHTSRPDLDNLVKLVLDACSNDILFADDCLVSSLVVKKLYDDNPRTEITVSTLKGHYIETF